jgi:hypothetical protein
MGKLNLIEITDRLTNNMAEYDIITGCIRKNAIDTIVSVMHEAGWDTIENNSTPDLFLNPFTLTQIVVFRGEMGLTYYYSENGTECPLDNLDVYTLVRVAQAVIREYEKILKK